MVGGVAIALAVSGCAGSGGDAGTNTTSAAPPAGPRTLTVWLMNGSAPKTLVEALHKEFQDSHKDVTVKFEEQQWNGIQDKLTTALSGNDAPDIIEVGNTQAPKFASEDVLEDLTASVNDFNGANWLTSLKDSGNWDGKQYGIPFYAANREVLYRKDMFEAAGITTPPTSRAEWLEAITKLKAKYGSDPDFQPLYLPGQNWYALLSFIYDEGGDIAKKDGTKFTATLDSPEAKAGIEFYKQLLEASGTKAPKDADEQTPEQAGIYGGGKVAMMIGLPWEVATAAKSDPTIKDKTSGFPIPSKTAGQTAPVFQGGSNLAIPAKAKNKDLAKDYLKLITSDKYQADFAKAGMIPGTSKDVSALQSDPVNAAMAKASTNGKAVPATPGWATIEAGQNPLKDMLTAYLTGAKTLDAATADANKALNTAFSG
ncbi:sugar ABC transporter substrate-binding protein [Actinokineospora auranticolor]|uniref:N,N'-diacetylchitobiose transport system substrate-binding protein n=1 Tax=Actinokineospora auranticolor TaxID=155976 RepID=A0A2S6H022_9PSEU|nr:sugar ABC transporter substrate-binding protein [Actinokineospora auranticolor]PPK70823.1 N,N'-diacetylchitobiose transport system substrate-binding protein [Actinokineospora auranticolor]